MPLMIVPFYTPLLLSNKTTYEMYDSIFSPKVQIKWRQGDAPIYALIIMNELMARQIL